MERDNLQAELKLKVEEHSRVRQELEADIEELKDKESSLNLSQIQADQRYQALEQELEEAQTELEKQTEVIQEMMAEKEELEAQHQKQMKDIEQHYCS